MFSVLNDFIFLLLSKKKIFFVLRSIQFSFAWNNHSSFFSSFEFFLLYHTSSYFIIIIITYFLFEGKKKLYVGNLPFESTEEDIQKVFVQYGDISDLYLPMRDGRPRGFCFVTMNDEGADKAMAELDGTDFQGRNLVVNEPLKKGEKLAPRASTRPQFKLYVGNLSFYTTHETLLSVFSEFGEVHDCYLPTDPESQQPRGFGFITMEQADGEAAINELDGLELDGRFIRVNEAQGKRRQSPAPSDESEVAEE
jgi:RNA recognition motif-containing protein